ncbi:MAG: hypothetical protein IID16_07690 [Candidatus Marinimicrobia bacterium]|nr:hypothetical protein [Candidatus Neomarinimicrobiota bacterium]
MGDRPATNRDFSDCEHRYYRGFHVLLSCLGYFCPDTFGLRIYDDSIFFSPRTWVHRMASENVTHPLGNDVVRGNSYRPYFNRHLLQRSILVVVMAMD